MLVRKQKLVMSLGIFLVFVPMHGFALDDKPLPFEQEESGPEVKLGGASLSLNDGEEDPRLSGFLLGVRMNSVLLSPSVSLKALYDNSNDRDQALYAYSVGISPVVTRLGWLDLYGHAELGVISEKVSSNSESSFDLKDSPFGSLGLTLSALPWQKGDKPGLGLFAGISYMGSFTSRAVNGVEFAAGLSWQTSSHIPLVTR